MAKSPLTQLRQFAGAHDFVDDPVVPLLTNAPYKDLAEGELVRSLEGEREGEEGDPSGVSGEGPSTAQDEVSRVM